MIISYRASLLQHHHHHRKSHNDRRNESRFHSSWQRRQRFFWRRFVEIGRNIVMRCNNYQMERFRHAIRRDAHISGAFEIRQILQHWGWRQQFVVAWFRRPFYRLHIVLWNKWKWRRQSFANWIVKGYGHRDCRKDMQGNWRACRETCQSHAVLIL